MQADRTHYQVSLSSLERDPSRVRRDGSVSRHCHPRSDIGPPPLRRLCVSLSHHGSIRSTSPVLEALIRPWCTDRRRSSWTSRGTARGVTSRIHPSWCGDRRSGRNGRNRRRQLPEGWRPLRRGQGDSERIGGSARHSVTAAMRCWTRKRLLIRQTRHMKKLLSSPVRLAAHALLAPGDRLRWPTDRDT